MSWIKNGNGNVSMEMQMFWFPKCMCKCKCFDSNAWVLKIQMHLHLNSSLLWSEIVVRKKMFWSKDSSFRCKAGIYRLITTDVGSYQRTETVIRDLMEQTIVECQEAWC